MGNIQTQLQTIRSQIELFRVRNNGSSPDIAGDVDALFSDLLVGTGNQLSLGTENSFGCTCRRPYACIASGEPAQRLELGGRGRDRARPPAAPRPPRWRGLVLATAATGEFAAAGFDESTNTWVAGRPVRKALPGKHDFTRAAGESRSPVFQGPFRAVQPVEARGSACSAEPNGMRRHSAFTLVEILIVVVIPRHPGGHRHPHLHPRPPMPRPTPRSPTW